MTILRPLIVIPVAMLIAIFAIRAVVFQAPTDHPVRSLQRLFAAHPDQLTDRAMREIGSAAAKGGVIPASARRAMVAVAIQKPLSPVPFLVAGTNAQIDGSGQRAEALFLAARLRDPRAPAARYFLADRYLRTNRIAAGLVEMAALTAIAEKASAPLAPALAAYARSPGAIPQLRQFFAGSPAVRDRTLTTLADNAANADIIMALAPPLPARQSPPPNWPERLVNSLIAAGDYASADRVWRQINGTKHRGLLYDPQFRDRSASPPFNWQFIAGSGGLAESSSNGGLNVIYYGRDDVGLATQMIRLAPGTYRLAMRVDVPVSADGLAWSVACVNDRQKPLLRLPLDGARNGVITGNFAVPTSGCDVQWIELRGRPGDTSETAQATISSLRLEPLGARL